MGRQSARVITPREDQFFPSPTTKGHALHWRSRVAADNRSQQARILRAGLTFTIDPKGKKKEIYSITFPLNVQGSPKMPDLHPDDIADITQQQRDELMQEKLTSLRGIKVVGFKDIEDDMITTSNTYGFRTAVDYDNKGL